MEENKTQLEMWAYLVKEQCAKQKIVIANLKDENKRLKDENKRLKDENKRLSEDLKTASHKILSDAGKIRMAAYNDAAKWNNAIAAKFDAMIKEASKTLFGRFVEKPIWKRMKRRWMSKRIAKQY